MLRLPAEFGKNTENRKPPPGASQFFDGFGRLIAGME
jgi:hypothetical protein